MTKKIVFGMALALVIVGLAAPSASAACNPPKSLSTYNSATGAFVYFHTTLASPTTLVGKIWDAAGDHTGTCNDGNQTFLYFGATPGDIGVQLSLGEACVPGCPVGSLSLQITAGNGVGGTQTIVTKTIETPAGGNNFDFSTQAPADLQLGPYPRPRATSSTRSSTNVVLGVGVDSSTNLYRNGTSTDITGFNVVSASSLTDPGPGASAYSLRQFVPAPGGTAGSASGITVDCTNTANDQWVALQLVSATGGPSTSVGERTRVKCNPALANPKYNVVPKKGMGTGTSN
jgi:hypothetical protein